MDIRSDVLVVETGTFVLVSIWRGGVVGIGFSSSFFRCDSNLIVNISFFGVFFTRISRKGSVGINDAGDCDSLARRVKIVLCELDLEFASVANDML